MEPDLLADPATGQQIRFLTPPGSDPLRFEVRLAPGGFVPRHVHARQQESIEVAAGRVRLRRGHRDEILGPGARASVPSGRRHRIWNAGDDEAVFVVEATPAMRLEEALRDLFALAQRGRLNRRGMPSPLWLAALAREYFDEMALPRIPRLLQRALIAPLARVARARGYRLPVSPGRAIK
jgi:quercetin dioxygenase-like cupin family protein